ARQGLHPEREGERAPPDVRPARATRHRLVQRLAHDLPVAGALVQPVAEAHQISFRSAIPVRNFLKSTSTQPSTTRASSGSMSRGEGPASALPERANLEAWQGQPKLFLSALASIEQPRWGQVAFMARTL